MKKIDVVSWAITICMLCIAVVGLFFMPDEIAVQWNENGVSSTVTKWIILAFPILAALLSIVHKLNSPTSENNYNLTDTYFVGVLIVFAAEIIIVGNSVKIFEIKKVDINLITKIVGVLLGCIFIYFGNKLPKIARNYYYGIKTPWALTDDDLWMKTQRIAGKTWFSTGIIIALLAFAPYYIQSGAIVLGAFVIILVPRIYSRRLAENSSK